MFPIFQQRLMIAVAAVLGGLVWLLVEPALSATGGWSGLSLLDAQVGWPTAIVLVLLAGVPAVALGLAVSAAGHRISGLFVVATALLFLAARGGAIDGLLWRADAPGVYAGLIGEVLLWFAGLAGYLGLITWLRPQLRPRLGRLATTEHLDHQMRLALPDTRALLAALVCAVIGAVLSHVLIQDSDTGQVLTSLVLAFGIAAMASHLLVPQDNPVGILLSPLATAVVAYGYVLLSYPSGERLMEAWYGRELTGLALTLPVHYASAAVIGCVLGLAMAQSSQQTHAHPLDGAP